MLNIYSNFMTSISDSKSNLEGSSESGVKTPDLTESILTESLNLSISEGMKRASAESIEDQMRASIPHSLPTVNYEYRNKGLFGWFRHVLHIYDRSVLLVIGLKYFSQGC